MSGNDELIASTGFNDEVQESAKRPRMQVILELFDQKNLPLLNFEWVAARIDPSLGPLPEGT
jgi:hypothetical protein